MTSKKNGNDAKVSGRKESADFLNSGSSLLNFMNLASGNVKTALEKPANFKRNINHRRYLQKQLRNYSKRKTDSPAKKSSNKIKANEKVLKSQALRYMKGIADARRPEMKSSFPDRDRNALRERNIAQNYWPETAACTPQEFSSLNYQPFGYPRNENPIDFTSVSLENFLADATCEYEVNSTPVDCIPAIEAEPVMDSEFMTGEELTRNLDIKDLYVPDLYSADRLLTDVQDALQPSEQISPSQYFLPSPSPYGIAEPSYFNFDHEGLPPIAMAFLSPGSLTHY
ncbi:predicted protein [Nematostella vectensis]|uniref:Uncharacterized protein n=1 Tax=Nematostella vectensis TaxID=45351 RepID=A7S8E6_NEMVE|nr:uncharacterized protein LOC5511748 [Nematostella vectensis]EDO40089.1 predicted protein [Nematostella vectensis]|eukprot:XP_001632152.1 predicted protein [Nematostella vectensis]